MRWVLSLPLAAYRLHLGCLLGYRFLVVTHKGRISGRIHRSVVEVVRYDRLTGEAFVITPWPKTAHWYRNILANPAAEVWIGGDRYKPIQRIPSTAEVAAALDSYAGKGRGESLGLRRLIGWGIDLPDSRRAEIVSRLGAVAYRPPG